MRRRPTTSIALAREAFQLRARHPRRLRLQLGSHLASGACLGETVSSPYPGIDRFSRLPTIKPRAERLGRDLIIGVEDRHGRVGRDIREASHAPHSIDLHECSDSVEAGTRARIGTRYVADFVHHSGYPLARCRIIPVIHHPVQAFGRRVPRIVEFVALRQPTRPSDKDGGPSTARVVVDGTGDYRRAISGRIRVRHGKQASAVVLDRGRRRASQTDSGSCNPKSVALDCISECSRK